MSLMNILLLEADRPKGRKFKETTAEMLYRLYKENENITDVRDDIFVHFTDIQKLGIKFNFNKEGQGYGTPLGIYAYPLVYTIRYTMSINKTREADYIDGGIVPLHLFPYAQSRKFLVLFKLKSKNIKLILSSNANSNDRDFYESLRDRYKLEGTREAELAFTKKLLKHEYRGVIDDNGSDMIHGGEPVQAVFFHTSDLSVLSVEQNDANKNFYRSNLTRTERESTANVVVEQKNAIREKIKEFPQKFHKLIKNKKIQKGIINSSVDMATWERNIQQRKVTIEYPNFLLQKYKDIVWITAVRLLDKTGVEIDDLAGGLYLGGLDIYRPLPNVTVSEYVNEIIDMMGKGNLYIGYNDSFETHLRLMYPEGVTPTVDADNINKGPAPSGFKIMVSYVVDGNSVDDII